MAILDDLESSPLRNSPRVDRKAVREATSPRCQEERLEIEQEQLRQQRCLARRRQVLHGKNTVGYSVYKTKFRKRGMPTTPDATQPYSNKRWKGMLQSWRIALHAFDPPDLVTPTASEEQKENFTKKSPQGHYFLQSFNRMEDEQHRKLVARLFQDKGGFCSDSDDDEDDDLL